jgi:crotonobetainyl-CoA:carnitine CoA-transferase CaiB-like acyl-CoA transferase
MRVVEISDREEAAAYAAKLFARWGAEVIKVESPDRLPSIESEDLYLNGGKQRLHVDRTTETGRSQLDDLLATADILLTDLPAVETLALGLVAPRSEGDLLVRVSITPFGLDGPYRDYEATAATLLALGGYTYLSGDPGRAPLTFPGKYPYYQAGTFAYIAALSAYLHVHSGGTPEPIEISVLESVTSLHQFTDVKWTHLGTVRQRHGNRWENLCPTTMIPVADGYAAVNVILTFWESFAEMLGKPELVTDPDWATDTERLSRYDAMDQMMAEAFAGWTRERFLREGQEIWRVPVGTVIDLPELLDDAHLAERSFWRTIVGADSRRELARDVRTPASSFRFIGEEPPVERAPLTAEVDARRSNDEAPPIDGGLTGGDASRPLEGLRVIDLTRIWSGPLATRTLGDLGAEVIKIEAPTNRGPAYVAPGTPGYYADGDPGEHPWNRNGLNNKLNRNKLGVSIDLKAPEGRAALLRLVANADVVIENFSARAMPSLGLGYDALKAANPQIIYVAMPAFGLVGPYRDYVGLGPSIEPLTGVTSLMGYGPDEPRMSVQAITDAMSGTAAAAAVLTALERRARLGEGAFIELSQHEAGISFIGEQCIEYQLTGERPAVLGNAHARVAPHGVYRCAGEDEWIAIAAPTEAGWTAFCEVAGRGWGADPRFATAEARLEHRAALDEAIEGWTVEREKQATMLTLLAAGVAAGAVNAAPEWLTDPHLQQRGYFFSVDELDAGRRTYDGAPFRFSGRRGYEAWTRSPGLGEHNRDVLGRVAGLPDAAINHLASSGVTVDRPPS